MTSGIDIGAAADAFRRCMEGARSDDERAYWRRHWLAAHVAQRDGFAVDGLRHFRYVGPQPGRFLVGPTNALREWVTQSDPAARALRIATLNPCRWLTLRPSRLPWAWANVAEDESRDRKAWHRCISDALGLLRRVDVVVADELAFNREPDGPGLHLRTDPAAGPQVRWRPSPNSAVAHGALARVALQDPQAA